MWPPLKIDEDNNSSIYRPRYLLLFTLILSVSLSCTRVVDTFSGCFQKVGKLVQKCKQTRMYIVVTALQKVTSVLFKSFDVLLL